MNKIYSTLIIMLILISCGSNATLDTVAKVDLEKYAGKWYEIAKLPNKFEKGLSCISATYSIKENGKIEVLNQGYVTSKGKWKDITGSARVPDPEKAGQLKVTFFWPFSGNYYIIDLAEDYSYALVGDPSRKYLWILARNQELDADTYSRLLDIAKEKGFDISLVEKVKHDCAPR